MSSLRLALKQSLQESGGVGFSSGHGEKKKRKKKKNSNSLNSNSNSNSNKLNKTGPITKRGRRPGEPGGVKRKRGRPRKYPRPDEDGNGNDGGGGGGATSTSEQQNRGSAAGATSSATSGAEGGAVPLTNNNNNNQGEDQQQQQRQQQGASSNSRSPRIHEDENDDDDDDENDEFCSENEFSYTEDDSDDEDDDDDSEDDDSNDDDDEDGSEDDDDDDDDDSGEDDEDHYYGGRTRGHDDSQEEDDGEEEDETMHSDDDDHHHHQHQHPSYNQAERKKQAMMSSSSALGDHRPNSSSDPRQQHQHQQREYEQQQQQQHRLPDNTIRGSNANANATANANSSEMKSSSANYTSSTPAAAATTITTSTSASDEENYLRKKLKLIKLKRKLKNAAANKIQNQWKKNNKVSTGTPDSKSSSSEGVEAANTGTTTTITNQPTTTIASTTKTLETETGSIASNFAAIGAAPSKPFITSNDHHLQKRDGSAFDGFRGGIGATITTTTAGDSGGDSNSNKHNNGEQQQQQPPPVMVKKKKKKNKNKNQNNNNGIVAAPTFDVMEWSRNMSEKRCKKNIKVGMRVKVRFATKVKREGKLVKKKIYYGGRVTAVSTKGSKIKIKYDDGTSEISKFPDKDVVVDAVDNGAHMVPADKFCPPQHDGNINNMDVNTNMNMNMNMNMKMNIDTTTNNEREEGEEEEGEIANANTVIAAEDGDGEMKYDRKPKASRGVDCSLGAIKKIMEHKGESIDYSFQQSHEITKAVATDMDTDRLDVSAATVGLIPFTPPPESASLLSSLSSLSKKDKSSVAASDNIHGDDKRMQPEPSPSYEEGELSPGITVTKSGESVPLSAEQHPQLAQVESKPFTSEAALLTSNITTSTATRVTVTVKQYPTKKNDTMVLEEKNKNSNKRTADSALSAKPKSTKKLSIRIPSNSLASIKGLSSPKSGKKSPFVVASNTSTNMDDVLADTPDSKANEKMKRKRIPDETTTVATTEQGPPKRRIKVIIGKNKNLLEKAAKAQDAAAAAATTSNNDYNKNSMEDIISTKLKLSQHQQQQQRTENQFEEMELARIAEHPVVETKKKKKKADRAKSPKPKPLVPRRGPSPTVHPNKLMLELMSDQTNTLSELSTPKLKIGLSKGSAFSEKKSAMKEDGINGPKQTSLKASTSAESIGSSASHRTGRKAAEDAKEKLSAKQKAKLSAKELKEKEKESSDPLELGKKKKKRRRKDDTEEHGEDSDVEQNETEWVQCDDCKKWRVLPDNVKVSSLPELWYCHMNMYDPKRRNCIAPEQTAKQALKERKRARKRAARMDRAVLEKAEVQQEKAAKKIKIQEEKETKKSKHDKLHAASSNTLSTTSPRPIKVVKSIGGKSKEFAAETKKSIADAKKANVEGGKKTKATLNPEEKPNPSDSGSDTQKEGKKKGKKVKKEQAQDISENPDADATAESKKPGRKRGRPARNQTSSTAASAPSSNDKDDEDNVEWVQCDKCEKWRKLPPDISADELPDIWNCSMNNWNPSSASCTADEDKTDAHHQEVGASEWQLRQSHAGKYSYRQMIFGTGARKYNRSTSERSRALESLFMQPCSTDEENPHTTTHPTTQYTKSSAFLPQKARAVEENTLGIFDVLRHSNLWEELRRMEQKPAKVLSSSSGNIPGHSNTTKLKTYESLSNEIKHSMQDVVLQTLEFGCLTGDEVISKTQWFPWETSIKGVAGIRGYCNADIIVNTLLDLVRDGIVEMATVRDAFAPISQWVPKYRRVGTRRALEAVEAIKASRCMKISKPWKQRSNENTTEWVTGGQRN